MLKKLLLVLSITLLIIGSAVYSPVLAAENPNEDIKKAEVSIDRAMELSAKGNLPEAQKAYNQFNKIWLKKEDGIKAQSISAYRDIEANMGKVAYAFSLKKQDQITKALQDLKAVNERYANGGYPNDSVVKQADLTLNDFILLLQKTKKEIKAGNQVAAMKSIQNADESWLSVEGTVVAKSASVYSNSERDLVTIQACLSANPPDYSKSARIIDNMVGYLTPLAGKTEYTLWDAAMILLREGLEALLVVISLMSFVKKSGTKKGSAWIWSGILAGLGISVILALIVKLVVSSGAFGNNNNLIGGWTGIFAAAMLLYMSYWLHSQASIADWNHYIRGKSLSALSTGKLMSLGFLAFLAVFREGTETVLFYIGMASQIKLHSLLIGLMIGAAALGIIAYLMVFTGLKLPLRPFFLVSSVIVFYLCIKFTGMGIHSLQLAGVIPTTSVQSIPSIAFFALYPSWENVIPQLLLLIGAIMIIIIKRYSNKRLEAVGKH